MHIYQGNPNKFNITSTKLKLDKNTHLIEQVRINLILNSVAAVKEEDNAKIKALASQNPNRDIVIKVYDNRPSILKDISDNIIVPFFTSKTIGSDI